MIHTRLIVFATFQIDRLLSMATRTKLSVANVTMKNSLANLINDMYHQVMYLRKRGLSVNDIVQKMSIDRQDIIRYWIRLGEKTKRNKIKRSKDQAV